MLASVTVSLSAPDAGRPEVQLVLSPAGDLVGTTELSGQGAISSDLMRPHSLQSISVRRWDQADLLVLRGLIGTAAVERVGWLLGKLRSSVAPGPAEAVWVNPAAEPWLRMAIIDALDRWLQLPLDQSLIDAERGVARGRVANTLPSGPSREHFTGEALALLRLSAKGLVVYLSDLKASTSSIPMELRRCLAHLVEGYSAMHQEVHGPDDELEAVGRAWTELSSVPESDWRVTERSAGWAGGRRRAPSAHPSQALVSWVDPRQLRARVVDLDPNGNEISMSESRLGDHDAVLVTVPAFGPHGPVASIAERLLVRLVDRRSGEAHGESMLTLTYDRHYPGAGLVASPVFTAVLPLRGVSPLDLRADVFDADSEIPPAWANTDASLLRVRRAVLLMAELRRSVAEACVHRGPGPSLRRLAHLTEILTTDLPADQPAFDGGPTPAELVQLAGGGDPSLRASSSSAEPTAPSLGGLTATTVGPGELLVAELATATSVQ
jgi:hypothetical protein